jgi:hypothetical protein
LEEKVIWFVIEKGRYIEQYGLPYYPDKEHGCWKLVCVHATRVAVIISGMQTQQTIYNLENNKQWNETEERKPQ